MLNRISTLSNKSSKSSDGQENMNPNKKKVIDLPDFEYIHPAQKIHLMLTPTNPNRPPPKLQHNLQQHHKKIIHLLKPAHPIRTTIASILLNTDHLRPYPNPRPRHKHHTLRLRALHTVAVHPNPNHPVQD